MAKRTLPGLGLTGFWPLGDNDWKDEMDENLRLLSALVNRRVKSRTAALPGTPSLGDIYIVVSSDPTNANSLAIWDGEVGAEAWVYVVPDAGWNFWVEDEAANVQWDGTAWVDFAGSGGSGGSSAIVSREETASDYAASSADFGGNVFIRRNNASANTVTINSGLTGTEPLTVVQTGAGATSFVAGSGVTINSLDGNLALAGQYASATLVPDGTDNYILIGALAA